MLGSKPVQFISRDLSVQNIGPAWTLIGVAAARIRSMQAATSQNLTADIELGFGVVGSETSTNYIVPRNLLGDAHPVPMLFSPGAKIFARTADGVTTVVAGVLTLNFFGE